MWGDFWENVGNLHCLFQFFLEFLSIFAVELKQRSAKPNKVDYVVTTF